MPGAQVPEDLLRCPGVINHGDDAHEVLADGAAQRFHMPHAQNQTVPSLGRGLQRRRWDSTQIICLSCYEQPGCGMGMRGEAVFHIRSISTGVRP